MRKSKNDMNPAKVVLVQVRKNKQRSSAEIITALSQTLWKKNETRIRNTSKKSEKKSAEVGSASTLKGETFPTLPPPPNRRVNLVSTSKGETFPTLPPPNRKVNLASTLKSETLPALPSSNRKVNPPITSKNKTTPTGSHLQQRVNYSRAQLFQSGEELLQQAVILLQAIIDGKKADVISMLDKNPELLYITVQGRHLKNIDGLQPEHLLTGLQCAKHLNQAAICEVILSKLPKNYAKLQLGGRQKGSESLAALRASIQSEHQRENKSTTYRI